MCCSSEQLCTCLPKLYKESWFSNCKMLTTTIVWLLTVQVWKDITIYDKTRTYWLLGRKQMTESGILIFHTGPMPLQHVSHPILYLHKEWPSKMDCQLMPKKVEWCGCRQCLPRERRTSFCARIYWHKTQIFLEREISVPRER